MKNELEKLLTAGGRYNCGPGLADDGAKAGGLTAGSPADAFAYVRTGVTVSDFETVLTLAAAEGAEITRGQVEALSFADLYWEGKRYYLTFHARLCRLCVSHDTVSTDRRTLARISERHTGTGACELYQGKLRFDKQCCGMFYVLHLPDGALFLLDGGHPDQASEEELAETYAFLRRIVGNEGKIRIAGWFISHAHGDHLGVPAGFIERYHDELEIESFVFNFPSTTQLATDALTTLHTATFRAAAQKYFPDTPVCKLHAGEVLHLCGAEIRVLYTHEDAADRFGRTMLGDFNSSSTVLRLTMNGVRVFFPGDIHNEAEAILLATYGAAYLRSDVLQVAHHCYNSLRVLYEIIDAPILLNPQGYRYVDIDRQRSRVRAELLPYATGGFYYADRTAWRITAEEGKPRVTAF